MTQTTSVRLYDHGDTRWAVAGPGMGACSSWAAPSRRETQADNHRCTGDVILSGSHVTVSRHSLARIDRPGEDAGQWYRVLLFRALADGATETYCAKPGGEGDALRLGRLLCCQGWGDAVATMRAVGVPAIPTAAECAAVPG